MRKLWQLWSFGFLLAGTAGLPAQMHKVAAPETVVRAIGVYEWTGSMAKPTASRLIPITLYINKNLEDAGVYLARPVPFALESGVVYELEQAGVPKGYLNLAFARHLQGADVADAYDDGWFGYGPFKGLVTPKPSMTKKVQPARIAGATGIGVIDPDRPHFVNRAGKPVVPASAGGGVAKSDADAKKTETAKNEDDPDRPHFSKKTETKDSSGSSGATPAEDSDRPTMKRRSGNDTASTAGNTDESARTMPPDDADRPTLKKRPVKETKRKGKESDASVTGIGSLNDDPDRPMLHRGRPDNILTEAELPKLAGLPPDLQQMVAVSDAKDRPVHDFSRAWEDDAERKAIQTKMVAMAQAQLAAYESTSVTAATVAPPPRLHQPNSKLRRPIKPLKLAMIPLADEQLKGYVLSYDDVPTFVYQARTEGEGTSLRYVTIVAQLDAQHEPKMVLHNVTDATHLDQTPRMRLVDAVDVEASNRASLLFEMRGQSSRQFAVYRLLGLQAQQIFSTGAMQ